MKTQEQEIKEMIELGLIEPDGTPIKCVCGCTDFKTVIKDVMENIVCEYQLNCNQCGNVVGYWAYGSWML